MDVQWFKARQRALGKTAADIAGVRGRDRSIVSKIYKGEQAMSLDWAQAFADVLELDLDEVLRRAGALKPSEAASLAPGFAESDAVPWQGKPSEDIENKKIAATFGGGIPGVDIWQAKTGALQLMGIMPGDYMLIDARHPERARAGNIVAAQVYDHSTGTAATLLRRYEPPVLVAASMDKGEWGIHVVDDVNVAIRGIVSAVWRGKGELGLT